MARTTKGRSDRGSSPAQKVVMIVGLFLGGVGFLLVLDLFLLYLDFKPLFISRGSGPQIAQGPPSAGGDAMGPAGDLKILDLSKELGSIGEGAPTPPQPPAEPPAGQSSVPEKEASQKDEFTFYQSLTAPGDQPAAVGLPPAKKKPAEETAQVQVPRKRPLKETHQYTLQVGSFAERQSADRLVARLVRKGYSAYMMEARLQDQGVRYRVRVGSFSDKKRARVLAERLAKREGLQSFVAFAGPENQ